MKKDSGAVNEKDEIAVCRCEITLELNELIDAVSKCLKFGGRFAVVHRAERLVDVMEYLRKKNIEPKRLQLVASGDKEPYLFMLEAVKGGKKGLKVLKTLVL